MTNIDFYRRKIRRIYSDIKSVGKELAPPSFPFEYAYTPQVCAIKEMSTGRQVVLSSHTGSGKTAVFLTQTYGRPSIIIEARKDIQEQVYGDYLEKPLKERGDSALIYGKSNYPCKWGENAEHAPCALKRKDPDTGQRVFDVYIDAGTPNERREVIEFPCNGCEYYTAKAHAKQVIKNGGTVVCNFGNYQEYIEYAEVVVIDEADMFFKTVSSQERLYHVDELYEEIYESLSVELGVIASQLENLRSFKPDSVREQIDLIKQINNIEFHKRKIVDLINSHRLCYQYRTKKRRDRTDPYKSYVKIRPTEITALKNRIFDTFLSRSERNRLIMVSATAGEFEDIDKVVTYSLPQRSHVFYSPIDNTTRRNVHSDPDVLKRCAEFIQDIHEMMKEELHDPELGIDSRKCVIHCVNGDYVTAMYDLLGHDKCTMHVPKKLLESLEEFKTNDTEYFIVASADSGTDFPYTHQFILKVPHKAPSDQDDELRALRLEIGDEAYNTWAQTDTLNTIIQQCGRVGRGANGFGCTWILDSSFHTLYHKYKDMCPEEFKRKLDMVTHSKRDAGEAEQFVI